MAKLLTLIGMGPGLGMALAHRFGSEGYTVAGVARNPTKLNALVADLQATGIDAHAFTADAGDVDNLTATLNTISEQLGATEVLIYNAAIMREGLPSSMDIEQFIADWRVSMLGAVVTVQSVVPAMREAGKGTILLTGGGLALNPYPPYASLAIAKAGLRNFAYSLAGELAETGIFVGTVTIAGYIQPDTAFDPALIAEHYWGLHTTRHETEVILR